MANSMVKVDIHIIFHIKSTSVTIRKDDLPRLFAYIGGILRSLGSIPIIVGGVYDHIHFPDLIAHDTNPRRFDEDYKIKKQQMAERN